MLFASMLALGALIGFVGAGGAGVTITLLTVGFHVPIHTALAVALASMVFTMLSGTISHFRQHEVIIKTGAVLGLGGIVGAIFGANFSNMMPSNLLSSITGFVLFSSAVTLYIKLYQAKWLDRHLHVRHELLTGRKLWTHGIAIGVFMGFISGAFGIGAAAYIQLALMVVFGVPLLQTIGTCMMVILPISAAGGLSYLFNGRLDFPIFIQTLAGLMVGAWFGAKGTHLAPLPLLKVAIVGMPAVGGIIMILFH
ncbi:sulfite exporter TauE/SafE family protein [Mitsuokella sp. WILCCON 0060]|uniref:sulfite exporter TauE/SafE family protein n=1 Tax=unclassified Mitsuokella TaxID=2637239 RepID=UPI003F0FCB8C